MEARTLSWKRPEDAEAFATCALQSEPSGFIHENPASTLRPSGSGSTLSTPPWNRSDVDQPGSAYTKAAIFESALRTSGCRSNSAGALKEPGDDAQGNVSNRRLPFQR